MLVVQKNKKKLSTYIMHLKKISDILTWFNSTFISLALKKTPLKCSMCKDVHCSTICQTENCKQQKKNGKINYRTYTRETFYLFVHSFIHLLLCFIKDLR